MQLTNLAEEYHEDLLRERVSMDLFTEMTFVVRRRVRWFPRVADILETREEAQANIANNKQAIKPKEIKEQDTSTKGFGEMCIFNIHLMRRQRLPQDVVVEMNTPIRKRGGSLNLDAIVRRNERIYEKYGVDVEREREISGSVIGGLAESKQVK